jgi:hypothetical protein
MKFYYFLPFISAFLLLMAFIIRIRRQTLEEAIEMASKEKKPLLPIQLNKTAFEGHTYIFSVPGNAFLHDPECKCKKEASCHEYV